MLPSGLCLEARNQENGEESRAEPIRLDAYFIQRRGVLLYVRVSQLAFKMARSRRQSLVFLTRCANLMVLAQEPRSSAQISTAGGFSRSMLRSEAKTLCRAASPLLHNGLRGSGDRPAARSWALARNPRPVLQPVTMPASSLRHQVEGRAGGVRKNWRYKKAG